MAVDPTEAPVIPIRATSDDDAGVRTRPEPPLCLHWAFELDEETRRVTCGRCGREIAPFNALLRLAHEDAHYVRRLAALQAQIRLADARLDGLKREERNAKARIRRAVSDA